MTILPYAAAALVAALFSQTASAACYVVYGPNNDIVYRDQTPPVDLSLQIHETLPIVAPGSTMVFSLDDFGCELSINKLPMSTLARQVGPRARRADRG